ncbi:Hypothetical protein R9X50_00529000 [Acrodontium crateriforme]|uniref:C2H2-type domain-containing protein n=1 Tax=Acrodontium crateriforme TaxID=150365 RepID=A0AAQ3M9B3_9PEZI|nr:Hypothetical protein R9X50_00529000 [Acrodontium crateriforme]
MAEHSQERNVRRPVPGSAWPVNGVHSNHQYLNPDDGTWLIVSHGSVDLGLSPALSYESQNLHTLNSFSEPDVSSLPPSLDLSFAEPEWTGHMSAFYHGLDGHQNLHEGLQSNVYTPMTRILVEYPSSGFVASQNGFVNAHHPAVFQHGSHLAYPQHVVPPQSVIQNRPLLPRTEEAELRSQPTFGTHRVLKPNPPGAQRQQHSAIVSNPSVLPGIIPAHQRGAVPCGLPDMQRVVSNNVALSPNGAAHLGYGTQPDTSGRPGYQTESSLDDLGTFFHFDRDASLESTPPARLRQQGDTGDHDSSEQTPLAPLSKPPGDEKDPKLTQNLSKAGGSNDGDEGRYRTHPLYSQGPKEDGFYHCPFAADPSCQHKPNKLKCNYEYAPPLFYPFVIFRSDADPTPTCSKFIDSHLKPFRCKMANCANQEFSSTACLLRHEREAHGMHGHGERPNLCAYHGCDRSLPGNGFPRRYNLFDHMKRVHDYKDTSETSSRKVSPDRMPESQKSGARKRKASTDAPGSGSRAKKSGPFSSNGQQNASNAQISSSDHIGERQNPSKQEQLYTKWANQKELLARQMSSVQSPDDEASLQRLSNDIQELRRLSQEARRG